MPEPAWTFRGFVADLERRGDEPAVIMLEGERVRQRSGGELADTARRLAAGLAADGVAPGAPVGLWGPNGFDWIVVRLALGLVGAVTVAVDDLADEESALALLADSGCARVFASAGHRETVARLEEPPKVHPLDEAAEGWAALLAETPADDLPDRPADEPVALFETSGTTGRSKRFTLSGANISANVGPLIAEGLIGPEDRVLLPLPLHHVYPQVIGLFTTLGAGAAMILPESTGGPDILRAIRLGRATTIAGVPRLYAALVAALEGQAAARSRLLAAVLRRAIAGAARARRRFGVNVGAFLFRPIRGRLGPELRLLVSGGAQLDPEILWKLVGLGWEVRSGYGLAETASIMTGNLPGRERLGSEGRPFQGGELRIAEPDGDGVGEVQMRGPNVFAGYTEEEHTEAAFTGDGWFKSGDLGWRDEDGFLYVTGRLKEVLVLGGGKKVMPERLEKLYGAGPHFEEVAVLEHQGSLVALVHPDEAAMRAAGLTRPEDATRVALAETGGTLAPYERLAGFALVREPLPRTRLGKYRRFLLPEIYRRAKSGAAPSVRPELDAEDLALLEDPAADRLWRYLQDRYPGRVGGLDTSLALDLGIDSLERVTLSIELERRFGIELTEEAWGEVTTVRELIEAAAKAPNETTEAGRVDLSPIEPAGGLGRAVAALLYWVNRGFSRLYFRLKVEGSEHLPREGRFVLAANHVSDLDPIVLAAALPLHVARRIHWGGDAGRTFGGPFRRRLARTINIFPVDERKPARTLALAGAVLDRGRAVGWFPESWRSPDGRLQRFLPGIGRLLTERGDVTVVPAYVAGSFEAMPRSRRFPRPARITIRFGAPVTAAVLAEDGAGEEAALRIADALHDRVARLEEEAMGPGGLRRPKEA